MQLYKVALSAGKAHRDHKHHHVHHFDHEGLISTTTTTPSPLLVRIYHFYLTDFYSFSNFISLPFFHSQFPPQQSVNPNLANGQISTRVRINLAGAQEQNIQPPQIIDGRTQFANGQFSIGQRLVAQQLAFGQVQSTAASPLVFPTDSNIRTILPPSQSSSSFVNLGDPANVQYIDDGPIDSSHLIFKRNENQKQTIRKRVKVRKIIKRDIKKKQTKTSTEKNNKKRALVQLTDGSVIDDKDLAENPFIFEGLSQFGAADFQEGLGKHADIEDEIREHDREPAEEEVRAVLELCSACEIEPFQGALVLAWKETKVQAEHALRGHSIGSCGYF